MSSVFNEYMSLLEDVLRQRLHEGLEILILLCLKARLRKREMLFNGDVRPPIRRMKWC